MTRDGAEYGPSVDDPNTGPHPGHASEESLRMRKSIGKKIHFQMGKKSIVGTILGYEVKFHSVSVQYENGSGVKMIAYIKLGRVTSYAVEA